MPVFEYKVRDQKDQVVSGTMEALTEEDLVGRLKRMNYVVTRISEVKTKKPSESAAGVGGGKIKQKEILNFIIKLANMLQVGISLSSSIRILSNQAKKPKLKKILNGIHNNISSGVSFSKSLSFYSRAFPDIMIRMVRVGETVGKLPDILTQYAEYAENQANIRAQIKSALTYPMAVITIAGIVLYIFLTFVIPKFFQVFKEVKIEMPLPTQILLNMSDFCRGYWLHALVGIVVLITGYRLAKRNKRFVELIDGLKLKVPGYSVLLKKVILVRFAQTLGLLYQSGIPILESIKTSEGILGNIKYSKAMSELHNHVKDGKKISDYIGSNPLFSDEIVEMINVGENTGRLSEMLRSSASFYQKEINSAVKQFLALLEPVILCCLGGFIAFLALSIVLPIFKMMSAVGEG